MKKERSSEFAVRLGVALTFGLVTFGLLSLFESWELSLYGRIALSSLLAIVGALFGPKAWQIIVEVL